MCIRDSSYTVKNVTCALSAITDSILSKGGKPRKFFLACCGVNELLKIGMCDKGKANKPPEAKAV